jgi:carbonic anhydrase
VPVEPKRKLAVLTCMDARLEVWPMFGLERGDAHVIRNAGGVVTDDMIRSLSVSQRLLGTEEVAVVMHEDCGMQGAEGEEHAFDDLEQAVRDGVARLAAELPKGDRVRGYVINPDSGELREIKPEG